MLTIIDVPAKVTLTAVGKSVAFVPYGQNFTYEIKAGDSVEMEVNCAEVVMYYLAQANENLTVTQEVVEAQ